MPEFPDAAKKETKAGLLAFVDFWFETVSYAYESGETKQITQMTMAGCGTCENALKTIKQSHRGESWMVGGKLNVKRTETEFVPNTDDHYQVFVEIEQERLAIYTKEGLQKETSTEHELAYYLFVAKYVDGKWRLVDTGPPAGSGE